MELGAMAGLTVNISVSKPVLRTNRDFEQWLCCNMYVCEWVN